MPYLPGFTRRRLQPAFALTSLHGSTPAAPFGSCLLAATTCYGSMPTCHTYSTCCWILVCSTHRTPPPNVTCATPLPTPAMPYRLRCCARTFMPAAPRTFLQWVRWFLLLRYHYTLPILYFSQFAICRLLPAFPAQLPATTTISFILLLYLLPRTISLLRSALVPPTCYHYALLVYAVHMVCSIATLLPVWFLPTLVSCHITMPGTCIPRTEGREGGGEGRKEGTGFCCL